MGTPAMLFGALASSVIAACTAFVVSVIILSRSVVFVDTWLQASLAQHEDAWLLDQCRTPEFFSRMQHHYPTLCSRVEGTPPLTPFQTALNAAIARPSALERACGDSNCLEALLLEWKNATGNTDPYFIRRYAAFTLAWLVLFNVFLWLARRILERLPIDCRTRRRGATKKPPLNVPDPINPDSSCLLRMRTCSGRKPPPPPLNPAQMGHRFDI